MIVHLVGTEWGVESGICTNAFSSHNVQPKQMESIFTRKVHHQDFPLTSRAN